MQVQKGVEIQPPDDNNKTEQRLSLAKPSVPRRCSPSSTVPRLGRIAHVAPAAACARAVRVWPPHSCNRHPSDCECHGGLRGCGRRLVGSG